MSHSELDEMTELDAGDLDLLTAATSDLRKVLTGVRVVGGCCGTDARHVAALWDLDPGPAVVRPGAAPQDPGS
jgi:homocysteine S-methyltransferase